MVVVPRLTEGDRSEPGEIACLVPGRERTATEAVAERVDAEGRVVQEEDANRASPKQAGETAGDGSGQRNTETERQGEAGSHPQRESAADEPHVAIGQQILRVAGRIGLVLAAKDP